MNPNSKIRNSYELIGLIKALGSPKAKAMALGLRQQLLINVLITYINNANVTAEIFSVGLTSLDADLLKTINHL